MPDSVGKITPDKQITACQDYIAQNPQDTDARLVLALLYDRSDPGSGKARASYLDHLVHTLGYEDAGTALASIEERLAQNPRDWSAHLALGQIHGYLGRRAEAVASLRRGTVWQVAESSHFRLHVVPGTTAAREAPDLLVEREKGLRQIQEVFRVRDRGNEPIAHFNYESCLHKELITGDGQPAHVFPRRREVHTVHGPGLRLASPHEDAHIVLSALGRPPKVLQEGAAEYAHRGEAAHAWYLGMLGGLEPELPVDLFVDAVFLREDPFLTYPLAASFVAFLLRRGERERFKRLYATAGAGVAEAALRIYGNSLEELVAAWRKFLDSQPRCTREGWSHVVS